MLEKTKIRNTSEEYEKVTSKYGYLGLISLLEEMEEKEEYLECNEILKALKSISKKHEKKLKYRLPIRIDQVTQDELRIVGGNLKEQRENIQIQKQRIKNGLSNKQK